MAGAQQTPSSAKLTPTHPGVNKTTCEKSVAKIGTSAPSMAKVDPFAAMDVNKDGKIGPTEFKGPKEAFAWVDSDHDGYITRPEATRAYLTIVGRMAIAQRVKAFKTMDENKDGKISLSEYRGPTRVFARVDVNHDGVITSEEAKNAFQASVGRFVIAIRFRTLDANHDGMISAAEFKGPKAAFAKFDRDKNGLIGPVEFAKMIQEPAAAVQVATAKPVPTPAKPVAVVTKTNVVKPVKTTSTLESVMPAANVTRLNKILAMDTDKDGKVGMGEYFKAVEARFVFLDQDKDGFITAQDLAKVAALKKTKATPTPVVAAPVKTAVKPAILKPAKPASVKSVKAVTAVKPVAAADKVRPSNADVVFDQIDVNHDGVLTRAEVKVYLAKEAHKSRTKTTAIHHKS
jgi:Ca2+-binding EF-hand superfamily protein